MNKKSILFVIALIIMVVLSSCGSTENNLPAADKDAVVSEAEEKSGDFTTEEPAVKTKEENSAPNGADGIENNNAGVETADENIAETQEDPYPYYPWVEQLPEGLEATVQKFDDFTILVRYTNNTGGDIALYTEGAFYDANGEGISSYSTIQEYIKAGDDYVAILECDDYFENYLLYGEIQKVGAKMQIANESLTVNSSVNSDGSIHIDMSTTAEDGTSVDGYVFFTDEDNNIVEYKSIGWGFEDEMSDDTEVPEHEYSDYFICVSAIA